MFSRRVHTPLLLQMEATECGAASLGIILAHLRCYVPLPELRRECGVSRDGSKASSIVKAARRYGLRARGFSKSVENAATVKTPFIIFWQFNHFLVVEGFSSKWVYLNDPAAGHRRMSLEEFSEGFTGVVLTMEKTEKFEPRGRPKNAWKGLAKRFSGNFAPLLICLVAGLLMVLPGLAMATYTRVFLDAVILDGRFGWFRPLMVAMLITTVIQACLTLIQTQFLRRLKVTMLARLNSQFYWHLLRLPMDFYSQRYPGEIAERAELNDDVIETLTEDFVETSIALFTMIFYGIVLFYYDAVLTSIGIAFAAINFGTLHLIAKRRIEANMKAAQDQGNVQATTIAGISSMETIKASGTEDAFFAKWGGYFAKASNARVQLEGAAQGLNVLPSFTSLLTTVCILVIGGFRVIDGAITIGMLVAIQTLMDRFLEPVSKLLSLGTKLQEMHGDLNRLDDVLENPVMPSPKSVTIPPSEPGAPPKIRLSGNVELRGINFGYNPLERALVRDFDLNISPGQRVALVGGSGSGKSTLAKIICGLFTQWSGDILFDNVSRDELPRDLLRNSLAMVEQEIFLFGGSVRENLALWDPTVSDESLIRACSDAHILDVVAGLPGGLDAQLLEGGANLSGGQRQRLEIARALVNSPSILVLDEATSALDAETERIIDENLRRRGCTTIIVAHRLSTIRDCEEIVVLERGKVVERGTHEELWQAEGAYHTLLCQSDSEDESGTHESDEKEVEASV